MKKKTYAQILDEIARDQVPPNPNLAPRTMRRIQKGKGITMQPRIKIFTTLMIVLLMLAVILTQVPAVTAAFQRWIGYIPGFGLVSEGQIRVLAEPVTVTRDGVTITVREGMLDTERTKLVYDVHGIPDTAFIDRSDFPFRGDVCFEEGQLRLPDGELLHLQGGTTETSSTNQKYEHDYLAVPMAVDQVILEIPCLRNTLPDTVPENWEIPLRFVPAPADLDVLPVVEIPTPTTIPIVGSPQTDPASKSDEIFLTLDRVVPMADGDLIYATVHWGGTDFTNLEIFWEYSMLHLFDGNGDQIIFEYDDDAYDFNPAAHQTVFAIKTLQDYNQDELTLVLDSAVVSLSVDAGFVFDPGPDPQPGQTWELNRKITFGEHTLLVRSVTAETDCNCYSFLISSADILRANLNNLDRMVGQYSIFGEGGFGSSEFTLGIRYDGTELPAGPLTLEFSSIVISYNGPWQVEWVP